MVVVMIMPVMMNICHYQQSFIFSMAFGRSCSSAPKISVFIFKYWPREMAKV